MASFYNEQGISRIKMFGKVHCFCPLGGDWYDADIDVELSPADTIMDYCDVDKFFDSLNGDNLIIEDVVSRVFNYFCVYYPSDLSVTAKVDNGAHLPVEVTKSM